MATVQGMCKNCGSLIVFNDKEDKCECVFCNCIFDGEEAKAILENPSNYTFPNEVIPENKDSVKHYYATPVFSDPIPSAIKHDKVKNQNSSEVSKRNSEFEISPDDVKAPKKTVAIIAAISVVLCALILVSTLPPYFTRTKLEGAMKNRMPAVFEGVASVDCSIDEDGKSNGFVLSGTKCQNISVVTKDKLTEQDAIMILENYASIRSEELGNDKKKDITMKIYCDGGYYVASYSDSSVAQAVFTENETEA